MQGQAPWLTAQHVGVGRRRGAEVHAAARGILLQVAIEAALVEQRLVGQG